MSVGIGMNLNSWMAELLSNYRSRTPKSATLYDRACRKLPGGTTYAIRFLSPYPPFISRARGPYVWDVDGNMYIDFWVGHGALILGHAPDEVLEKVEEQLWLGTHYGYDHELALELAELVTKVVPNVEMIRFTNSGTEANMYALRLARAYTKRNYIVKIEGGWHGGYDGLHKAVTKPYDEPESAGLPDEYLKYTLVVPFNDVEALEKLFKSYEIAAVIVEPIMGAAGIIPPEPNYLKELRKLCDAHGSLLIFDEVITGFRVALGGAQEYFGVKADIVTMGKILGGGFPIGAIASRSEIMELMDHIKHPRKSERAFHGGTFTANPISMVAGKATIEYLSKNRWVYDRMNSLGLMICRRVDELRSTLGIDVYATYGGSMVGLHFTKKRPVNAREAAELWVPEDALKIMNLYFRLNNILYISEKKPHFFLSTKHQYRHVEKLVSTLENFLIRLKSMVSKN